MIINHNMGALNANRQMGINQTNANKSMEKLSSGLRINRAGDDAAGLAISEKMRGQIRGLDQAASNAQDGISLIQTAEGALNETHSILQRMRELSVQSSNGTATDGDRNEIDKEITQLKSEVDRISTTTEFNTKKLLDGKSGVKGTVLTGSSNGSFVSGNEKTTAGTYTITVDTDAATKATTAAGSVDFSTAKDVSSKALSINGVNIDFSGMTSAKTADVVAKINEYSAQTGVTASGTTTISLSQTKYGSANGITLAGANAAEFAGVVTAGKDVKVDVTGGPQDVIGNGQQVTFAAGTPLEGVTINMNGAAGSSMTLSIAQGSLSFQIGANEGQDLGLSINEMSTATLGTEGGTKLSEIDVTNQDGAKSAITVVDDAIKQVSAERAKLGAYQNRLEHTINNLGTSSENMTSAESRIRDVNMAKEMSQFSKNNILSQAAQAMLAQANQQPQQVLQLLR